MAIVVDVKSPTEVRRAALRVLNKNLGYEATQAFMAQSFRKTSNYTEEKYERSERSFEEYTAELERVDAEMRSIGEYDDN